MTPMEQAAPFTAAGWEDGSGREQLLRHPHYAETGITLFTIAGVWHARCKGVISDPMVGPATALQNLRDRVYDRRGHGARVVAAVEAAFEDAFELIFRRT